MSAPENPAIATPQSAEASPSYAPYAQLAKMLVPSSGSISIYKLDGDLVWCSDGYEHPDLRELVEAVKDTPTTGAGTRGGVRRTASDTSAFVAELENANSTRLGFVVIELASNSASPSASTMTSSLLRPLLECLASRIDLEQASAAATQSLPAPAAELEMLLSVNELEASGPDALRYLLTQCVEHMGCLSAVFTVPDQDVTVVAKVKSEAESESDAIAASFLDRHQKHLLAWAQLNNRPMVVNRVGTDPSMAPYKILSSPVRDRQQRVTGLMALFRSAEGPNFELGDVRLLELLSRRAMSLLSEQHDGLTGLMTRRVFEERLERCLPETDAADRGWLLHVDIDRLQAINDAFGLKAGDEVIQRLAHLLRRTLLPGEFACRIAGDRFAVYAASRTESEAASMANGLLEAMAQLGYMRDGQAVPVTISIGGVARDPNLTSGRHMMALSELAGRRAQQQGGNRFETFTPDHKVSALRETELFAAASLQHALKHSDFRLQAQTIIGLASERDRQLGYEVLVRMRDAAGNLVSPDKFFAAASRYALLPAVDRWVFAATVRELEGRADFAAALPVGIAINVSEQSLLSREYRESIIADLERSKLPGSIFCFELTESVALNHPQLAEQFIDRMKAAGCRVALDDFGTGLTSLVHLRRLHVDFLKIDGGLIRRLLDDRHVESLVLGLARAAESLGLKTIAEHVESAELANRLRSIGIDYAQGFHFGRPRPLPRVLQEDSNAEPARAHQS
jgi:diguanylate cyclase (GGDEF)-like protein